MLLGRNDYYGNMILSYHIRKASASINHEYLYNAWVYFRCPFLLGFTQHSCYMIWYKRRVSVRLLRSISVIRACYNHYNRPLLPSLVRFNTGWKWSLKSHGKSGILKDLGFLKMYWYLDKNWKWPGKSHGIWLIQEAPIFIQITAAMQQQI